MSGSGKSSLAFDTIFDEGLRRYMQAVGYPPRGSDEAPFDMITGLSPTIAVEQRTTRVVNPRSTVGTKTIIYNLLRMFYAIEGVLICPICKESVEKPTLECDICGMQVEPLQIKHFSFNEPSGMCLECKGRGYIMHFTEELIVKDPNLDLIEITKAGSGCFADQLHWVEQLGDIAYYSGKNGGDHNKVLACLTGNMLWSLIRFGYLEDPRIQKGKDWIVEYQRFDDGIEKAPEGWPYNVGSKKGEACWGKHTCHMAVVKNLKALVEIPLSKRSVRIKDTINKAAEYTLIHHIYKQSHNLDIIAKQEWTQFGFSLMWKIDTLEVLDILTKIGFRDDRMIEAIDLVLSKQNENGRWILEKTFY